MSYLKQTGKSLLQNWINLVQKASISVIVVTFVITAASFHYTTNNLGMNTDTKDMLSPDLLWRQLDAEYERYFPQFTNNILVVIEAPTPDQAQDAAMILHQRLTLETTLFKTVYYPSSLPVFRESGLLFLDTDELQDLTDNLAVIQPFLSRLTTDQSIRGLFSMLVEALDAIEEGDDIDIDSLLDQINLALIATQGQQAYRVSWQNLMNGGEVSSGVYREFIILQPHLDYSGLLPGEDAINRIHQLADELLLESEIGAQIRLTGSVVLSQEELLSVSRGMGIALILALLMVTIIMVFGLGSIRLVAATLITLVTGLILTAAFAAFAVGNLNLISVAFAVLYIGLGVDFAIHYCLRYREFRLRGRDNKEAISATSATVGTSLFLCATTTSVGFFAFIPTDYLGVAELGLISGGGMFISLFITLSLLPAILVRLPYKPSSKENYPSQLIRKYLAFPINNSRQVLLFSFLIALTLFWYGTQVSFDPNTLNLQDPDNDSVKTYQDLLADSDTTPWTGIILAKGESEARIRSEKLEQLPLVEKTVSINDFIPDNQEEKLLLIEEMYLILGEIPPASSSLSITDTDRRIALSSMYEKLNNMQLDSDQPGLLQLKNNLRDYLEYLSILDTSKQSLELQSLEHNLLDSLPGRLDNLSRSLNADYITVDTLPKELADRWHNEDDLYLIEIYPRENIENNGALRSFVKQLQDAEPEVIGSPVISIEASDAVVSAFKRAFLYAFIVITLLLLTLLKNKRDGLCILTALVTAAICTAGISTLLQIQLNFANIIALPLILGIGVDSGIHIVHRFRTDLPTDNSLLATSSARAVFVSALTTMVSIGNLAFSSHLGTASMGKILSIGIIMTSLCMLIFLPAILATQIHEKKA